MKILVCRFSSLGDVLLTTPVLRLLRKKFPSAQIDFLVKKEFADVLRFNRHISRIREFSGNNFIQLAECRSALQKAHYDIVIDLHNSLRSRFLRFLLARQVFVVRKDIIKRWLLVNFKKNYYPSIISVPEKYIRTIAPLGIVNDDEGLELCTDENTSGCLQTKFTEWNIDGNTPLFVIAPTAKHTTKMWLPEYYIALGKKIAKEHNAKICVSGAGEEKKYCDNIASEINAACAHSAISTAGILSLLETAALVERCSAVITNDSAMMHIAAALQKKVIAIFGSTVEEFGFFPYRTNNKVVQNIGLQCRPCSHIGKYECPQLHFKCIKDISVEHVYESLLQLLGATNSK